MSSRANKNKALNFKIWAVSDSLKEVGMKVSIPDLLEQWHKLVEYAKKAFSFAKVSYLVTWCKIFTAPRCKG